MTYPFSSIWGGSRTSPRVTFNGTALGILWKPPFRVDISDLLEPDNNLLEGRGHEPLAQPANR